MARLVLFKSKGPVLVGDPPVAICGCGLSKKWPYCTGAHIHVAGEEEGAVYAYNGSGVDRVRVQWLETVKGRIRGDEVYSPA